MKPSYATTALRPAVRESIVGYRHQVVQLEDAMARKSGLPIRTIEGMRTKDRPSYLEIASEAVESMEPWPALREANVGARPPCRSGFVVALVLSAAVWFYVAPGWWKAVAAVIVLGGVAANYWLWMQDAGDEPDDPYYGRG